MDEQMVKLKNALRAAGAKNVSYMQEAMLSDASSFEESFAMGVVALAAANAHHPEDKTVAELTQSYFVVTVRIVGKGSDLKRVHAAMRQRGYVVTYHYANSDNSFVNLKYATSKEERAPKVEVIASFPNCERVEVGTEVVTKYKVVCGDDSNKFPALSELDA